MIKRLDRPESWLALQGFLIAFAWEMLQMPFFEMADLSGWQQTRKCALASLGDAGIMVFAYLVARFVSGSEYWCHEIGPRAMAAYLGTGLAITVAVERVALRSGWGWEYSELMPTLAGIGLLPVIMWLIVPSLALLFAARLTTREGERA